MAKDPTTVELAELIRLNRYAGSLRLRATHVHARQTGQYLSRFKGRGMEFDESRPYQPGDDVRNIDWRVTARTGNTHTKLFHEERERPVFIGVDQRSAMFFATQGRFKSVIAAELAALIAWAAANQGDRIGGVIFSESGHREFRPHRGKRGVLPLLKALLGSNATESRNRPENKRQSAEASLTQACTRLQRIAHPGSLVCIISDFRGLNELSETRLANLGRHNEVILLQVYDPLETQLPRRGRYRLTDGQRLLALDTGNSQLQQRYAQQFQQRASRLQQLNSKYRLNVLDCQTTQSPLSVLQQAFGIR